MDTTWFAIDADGQIATLESGEEGPIPWKLLDGDATTALEEGILALDATGEVALDLEGRGGRKDYHAAKPFRGQEAEAGEFVFFLDEIEPYKKELGKIGAVLVPSTGKKLVVVVDRNGTGADLETWMKFRRKIHRDKVCRRCDHHYADNEDLALRGVFKFAHIDGGSLYGRRKRPLRPLTLDELPPELREIASKAPLFDGVSFSDVSFLDPWEFFSCQSWEEY